MSGIVVVAEHRRGVAREITFELIATAIELKAVVGQRVVVLVVGASAELAESLGADGVDEIIAAEASSMGFDPALTEAALGHVMDQVQPDLILAGHTVDGFGFAPAFAAQAGLGFAANVISAESIDGELIATRGVYGDRLVAELRFDPGPVLLMIRPGGRAPATRGSVVPVSAMTADIGKTTHRHLGFRDADTGGVDITKSDFLLSIGRGIGGSEAIEAFDALANAMGATLSASRPLVDAGWIDSGRQVGQSGRTVKPAIYLALGISGAVQHLAGIRDAETVIAINSDPEAPIFGVADHGALTDVHELAEALMRRL